MRATLQGEITAVGELLLCRHGNTVLVAAECIYSTLPTEKKCTHACPAFIDDLDINEVRLVCTPVQIRIDIKQDDRQTI